LKLDPSGTEVITDCPIEPFLQEHFVESQGTKLADGKYHYTWANTCHPDLFGEILETMIVSPRKFSIAGGKDFPALEILNFELHVEARIAIVDAARAFGTTPPKFGLPPGGPGWDRLTPTGPTGSASVGLRVVARNPKAYTFDCEYGSIFAQQIGLMNSLGNAYDKITQPGGPGTPLNLTGTRIRDQSGAPSTDWVPSDRGYFKNNNKAFNRAGGFSGEYVIYLGGDEFFGHGLGIISETSLTNTIEKDPQGSGWNTSGGSTAAPTVDPWREYPKVGLGN